MTPEPEDLPSRYLLALMTRDAKIWKKHHRRENSAVGADADNVQSAATADADNALSAATAATGNTFEGHQCRKCGGFLRYKSSHKCVECRRQRNRAAAREQKRIEQPNSIRAFAIELIKVARHKDRDGREIGLTYDQIRDAVLRKFPTVKTPGRHYGRPTVLGFKELHEIASILKRNGETIPFRPRRPRSDAGKRRVKATAQPASAPARRVASHSGPVQRRKLWGSLTPAKRSPHVIEKHARWSRK